MLNDKILIVHELAMSRDNNDDGKLPRGKIGEVAIQFGVDGTTISRVWKRAREAIEDPLSNSPSISSWKKLCGRRPIYDSDAIAAAVKELPLNDRKTFADMSKNLDIPVTSLFRITKETGCLRPHTSLLRPTLTPAKCDARYEFCLNHLGDDGMYKSMKNIVHVDEKWFYLTSVNAKYYLAHDERPPHRSTRHKSHIDKVMFLAAIAQPQHYYHVDDMHLPVQER
jgi:hypothetical protein